MNDNDIIKALERCATTNCKGCPYFKFGNCSDKLQLDAVDLINRQKAEIERLYKSLNLTAREQYINGRNDGIKEFAEKLKEKAFYVQESEWDGYVVDCNDIIEFAKEMTEGWEEHH